MKIGFVWGEEWKDKCVAQSDCFLVLKNGRKNEDGINIKIVLWENNGCLYYQQIMPPDEKYSVGKQAECGEENPPKTSLYKFLNYSLWVVHKNHTQGPLQVKKEIGFVQLDSDAKERQLMIECGSKFSHLIPYNDIKNGEIHFELIDWVS